MKKLTLILLLLFSCALWGQTASDSLIKKENEHAISFEEYEGTVGFCSLGISKRFMDNHIFNEWTTSNYHKTIKENFAGVLLDMGFIWKKYIGSVSLQINTPLNSGSFNFGQKIIKTKNIRSFISLGLGVFSSTHISGIIPPNYVLTSSQIGKTMYLQYTNLSYSISSKTFFYKRPNPLKLKKLDFPFLGVDIRFDYMPSTENNWQYGYINGTAPKSPFVGNTVNGIPSFSKVCFSVSLSIGII